MFDNRCLSHRATIYFSPQTGRLAMQTVGSLDALYQTADEAEELLVKIGKEIEAATGGELILGPRKEREVAENKIKSDYDGKPTLITDIVRAKLVIKTAESINTLRNILHPENENVHAILARHGAYSAQMADYFAEPKFETGYRALNVKIAIPLQEEDQYHLVELQVVHDDLEKIYDKTHKHMREAQNIASKYRYERIPNEQAIRMAAHYAVCRYENGKTSKDAGLDPLLRNSKDALTSKQAESLEAMIRQFRYDY